jgi:hypothetical protein
MTLDRAFNPLQEALRTHAPGGWSNRKRFCCRCAKEKRTTGGRYPNGGPRCATSRFICADCLKEKE